MAIYTCLDSNCFFSVSSISFLILCNGGTKKLFPPSLQQRSWGLLDTSQIQFYFIVKEDNDRTKLDNFSTNRVFTYYLTFKTFQLLFLEPPPHRAFKTIQTFLSLKFPHCFSFHYVALCMNKLLYTSAVTLKLSKSFNLSNLHTFVLKVFPTHSTPTHHQFENFILFNKNNIQLLGEKKKKGQGREI